MSYGSENTLSLARCALKILPNKLNRTGRVMDDGEYEVRVEEDAVTPVSVCLLVGGNQ